MASIKLKFRPSTSKDGEGTLYFQIIHRRVARNVNIDCRVRSDEWDDKASFIRITGTQERREWLQLVASKVRWNVKQLTSIVAEKETAMIEYGVDDIVSAYRMRPTCETWFSFVQGMVAKKMRAGRHGTAKTYRDALSSFACFRNGVDIAIDTLDEDNINMYEAWLKDKGLKKNSISCYMRTLRTLYRKAVEEGLTKDQNIFSRVFTGFAKTAKRAVTLPSIREIRRLRLPTDSPIAFARDIFILSIYLQGISFVDLAYLKKTDIRNGLLQYDRKKTGQTISIGWEPQMQEIVDGYAYLTKGSPYLLPIITKLDGTERRQYENMEHNINRNLKKVGEMVGLHIPLTTYVARHTWASTMRDLGNDISVVSRGLGHESLKTTQVYLSLIDTSTVMKANRRMIGKIVK